MSHLLRGSRLMHPTRGRRTIADDVNWAGGADMGLYRNNENVEVLSIIASVLIFED